MPSTVLEVGMKSDYEISDDIAHVVGGTLMSLILLSSGVIGGACFLLG